MAKEKKKIKAVVKDASGGTVAIIEPRYKMVPFDIPTHDNLLELCRLRGFGKRGQGAMMRILVRDALAKARTEIQESKTQ